MTRYRVRCVPTGWTFGSGTRDVARAALARAQEAYRREEARNGRDHDSDLAAWEARGRKGRRPERRTNAICAGPHEIEEIEE